MVSMLTVAVSAVDPVSYIVEQFGDGSATWSTTQIHSGSSSLYIDTGATVPSGGMGRIRFMMPEGTTLADIETMSWYYFLEAGYPPHVDIYLDVDSTLDCLTFEYGENDHSGDSPPAYGALEGAWYKTFSDDTDGPAVLDDDAIAWSNSGGNLELHTLGEWKNGITVEGVTIDASTPVTLLQFQMDSWMIQSQAYLDDVEINGVTYDLESTGIIMVVDIVAPMVSIGVDLTDIAFDSMVAGTTSDPHTVTITSTSNVDIVLSASVNEDGSFYTDNLELGGGSVSAWTTTLAAVDTTAMVDVVLVVPIGTPPGSYTGTLVFTATPPPPL